MANDVNRIHRVKAAVDIESLARERYGIVFNGSCRARCPFPENHRNGDADPSLGLDRRRQTIRCWSQRCYGDKGADVIDLVRIMDGVDFEKALTEVEGFAGLSPEEVPHTPPADVAPRGKDAERNDDDEVARSRARKRAASIWRDAAPASEDHPYLVKKGVRPHGLRSCGDKLVVPVSDGSELHSLQSISSDGKKLFLPSGRVKGHFFLIGDPKGTICIAEGFATGATIHEITGHAVVVAFNAGNLLPVAEVVREKYPDGHLIVCADDDAKSGNPGLTKAQEAAQAVGAVVAVPDFGDDRPKGATDFNDLCQHAGSGAVRSCIERADGVSWPDIQTLPDATPDVEPFDTRMLPAAFSPWVKDVADRMQCPPDYPAVGLIVALSAVVGRQIAIRPKATDDWTVVANLWGGIVGRPGLLKTPALQEAMRPLDMIEARAREEYVLAVTEYEAEKLVVEAQVRNVKDELRKALKNGEDALSIARTAVEAPDQDPRRRRYIVHDPTVEKLGEILRDNSRGVLIFRDELSGFLRSLDREGRESDRAFYLEAWNGTGRFSYDRIGRGTIDIDAACVSILGGIQPGPLSAYLGRALRGGADDDGLAQRFQLVVWPDISEGWKNVDKPPDASARRAAYEVFERLDGVDLAHVGAHIPEDGSLPFLRFSPVAQEIFTEWRSELEHRLREDELPPMLEGHLAKYRSLIPSLALLIFLADGKTGAVDEDSLLRACAWGDYLESHVRRIYAPALLSDLSAAIQVGERIKRGDLGTEFSIRDVQRKGWSGLTERDTIAAGIEILEEMDWLKEVRTPTEGRTRTRYRVNPKLGGAD